MICSYFLSVYSLSFHFPINDFEGANVLILMKSNLSIFLLGCALDVESRKALNTGL